MKGSKYLSEAVNIEDLRLNELNLIKAPTGCGKTTFAINTIPSVCEDYAHKAVFLIDSVNGKEQVLKNKNTMAASSEWISGIAADGIWFDDTDRLVIMTYAKFGTILEKYSDFYNRFRYIICDEMHNLIKFQSFSPKPNCHSVARTGLEKAVSNDCTIVIALTATPSALAGKFCAKIYEVPIDYSDLRRYEVKETVRYRDLNYIISSLEHDETGICYTSRITQMLNLQELAVNEGLKPICIWSVNNADNQMNDEQMRVRKSILTEYTIPEQYNFLIINASSETSIKIKSPVDYVIVNSSNTDTQIQVKGRVDGDLSTLYLPATADTPLEIPEEFLGVILTPQDKARLCETLNLSNQNGRPLKWASIHSRLIDEDYTVSEKRVNNRRCVIITPPSNNSG